jgi:uncharacterized protein (DUF302 family)
MMNQEPAYGRVATVGMSFTDAVDRVRLLLKEQGFGILCEIDVAKTLREKIGADLAPYLILGACNPQLAHRALQAENQLGLLLPCNVVVQSKDGGTVVSAVNARAMLRVAGNPQLEEVARDADARLQAVIDGISS